LNADFNKIINVNNPTNDNDGANKYYVDNSFNTNYNSRITNSISSYNTTYNIRNKTVNLNLTSTYNFVYVDLTKPHIFLMNAVADITSAYNTGTLYIFPLKNGSLAYRMISYHSNSNAEKIIWSYVNNNYDMDLNCGPFRSVGLLNGVLRIRSNETCDLFEI